MMRCKPMLAYPVSDKPIDYGKPTFIQPKLDGVRCVIQNNKREGYEVVEDKKAKKINRCGECNWVLEGGEKFCPECGANCKEVLECDNTNKNCEVVEKCED